MVVMCASFVTWAGVGHECGKEEIVGHARNSANQDMDADHLTLQRTQRKQEASVTVLDLHYNHSSGVLRAIVNGMIESTGECEPHVKVGLLRQNVEGQWDTLVYPGSAGMIPCGPLMHNYHNDTVRIQLPVTYNPIHAEQLQYEGAFKILFRERVRGAMEYRSSNSFFIDRSLSEDRTSHPLRGFLDTTVVASYQFYQLHFYHMREFRGEFGGHYRVWHRMRISRPHAETPFIFDHVFSYWMHPTDSAAVYFAADDYNLDGCQDFRICSDVGGYDYYLYDPDQGTFLYSAIFSTAISIALDSEGNTLTAHYERFVPLEGMYHHEAIFALRDMTLLALYRLHTHFDGLVKEPVDVRDFHLPPRITGWTMAQPEVKDIYDNHTQAISNKRHFFSGDEIDVVCKAQQRIDTSQAIRVKMEKWDIQSHQWTTISSREIQYAKSAIPNDTGFKWVMGQVAGGPNRVDDGLEVLVPGTYSVAIWQQEKWMAQTPPFFVFD
jgi:hypothetical protein